MSTPHHAGADAFEDGRLTCLAVVRTLRRAFLALGVAGVIAAALRLRGGGDGVPPQGGGWRELSGPDLRT